MKRKPQPSQSEMYGEEALHRAMERGGDLFEDQPKLHKPITRLDEGIKEARARIESAKK